MAGTEIIMAENATIMIHDPWSFAMGNASEEVKGLASAVTSRCTSIVDCCAPSVFCVTSSAIVSGFH